MALHLLETQYVWISTVLELEMFPLLSQSSWCLPVEVAELMNLQVKAQWG